MKMPRRITLLGLMVLVAITGVGLGLGARKYRRDREEYYRQALSMFGMVGSRSHFVSAEAWREYLDECKTAEEILGVNPRHFSEGGSRWTDRDEQAFDSNYAKFKSNAQRK